MLKKRSFVIPFFKADILKYQYNTSISISNISMTIEYFYLLKHKIIPYRVCTLLFFTLFHEIVFLKADLNK